MIYDVEFWSIAFKYTNGVIEPTAHFWPTRERAEEQAAYWRDRTDVTVVVYRLTAHLAETATPVVLVSPIIKRTPVELFAEVDA